MRPREQGDMSASEPEKRRKKEERRDASTSRRAESGGVVTENKGSTRNGVAFYSFGAVDEARAAAMPREQAMAG